MTQTSFSPANRNVVSRALLAVAAISLIAAMPLGNAFLSLTAGEQAADCLVVIHGLLRTERNTARLARQFDSEYDVLNFGYNSRQPIDVLATELAGAVDRHCADDDRTVHFAAHSMGGIVVRRFLEMNRPDNLGRVVLLGPPNSGSELVDRLPQRPMRWIAGESALMLGTEPDSAPNALAAVDFELGVIAGGRSIKPIASRLIPGDDDGLVAVERTRVDGMRDHIVMAVHHQELVKSPAVAAQVAHFIANGTFDRPEDSAHSQPQESPSDPYFSEFPI